MERMTLSQRLGLAGGLALFAGALILPAPAGLDPAGWHVLGLALLMAVWWSTEPVPVGITALLPLIVLPFLGAGSMAQAAAPYAHELVFLFLGGFLLAAGVKHWHLHARLAGHVIALAGTGPARLVLAFMAAAGFLSMWISNTAAVVLMLPVALSLIATLPEDAPATRRFALALLLGLAYAANIGGVGTLIGTPPNALMAAWLAERHGIALSFAGWAMVGMPVVAVFLPLGWWLLVRVIYPVPAGLRLPAPAAPGAMGTAERRVALIFAAAALAWIFRPLINQLPGLAPLTDTGIALMAGLALFLVPSGQGGPLLRWPQAQGISWGVLLLFGGGLSLAAAMERSGLAGWIGAGLAGLEGVPPVLVLLAVAAVVVFLTELVSNTAVVAALLPVMGTVAAATGVDPIAISAAVALAASCAFMLPAATPPNALVFASGHVTVAAMVRAGLWMNIASVGIVTLAAWALAPLLA